MTSSGLNGCSICQWPLSWAAGEPRRSYGAVCACMARGAAVSRRSRVSSARSDRDRDAAAFAHQDPPMFCQTRAPCVMRNGEAPPWPARHGQRRCKWRDRYYPPRDRLGDDARSTLGCCCPNHHERISGPAGACRGVAQWPRCDLPHLRRIVCQVTVTLLQLEAPGPLYGRVPTHINQHTAAAGIHGMPRSV